MKSAEEKMAEKKTSALKMIGNCERLHSATTTDCYNCNKLRAEVASYSSKEAITTSNTELQQVANDHRAGHLVDFDKLVESHKRGYISQSDAMNSDF